MTKLDLIIFLKRSRNGLNDEYIAELIEYVEENCEVVVERTMTVPKE